MLTSKYSKTTFYYHNVWGYDVIFIVKVLVDYYESHRDKYELSFKFRDNVILSMTIRKGSNKLIINHSYAILNSSLRDLSESFDCEYQKSYFPYYFSTESNLFYIGNTPDIRYYEKNVSRSEYDKFSSDSWDFKEESLKYLKADLDAHYEVLSKANKRFFLDYDVDMTNSYSIPGLALKLYLSKYYKNNIPNINKKSIYTELKQAYYRGITEVYIPQGKDIFYYNINSLYSYPSLNSMPGLLCKIYINHKY